MQHCDYCKKWKLVSLTKRFDDISNCPECLEQQFTQVSSFHSLSSYDVECCTLNALQQIVDEEGNKFTKKDLEHCLFYSAKAGRKDLVEMLLNRGVSPNTKVLGRSPLIEACENSDERIVAELLKYGANINEADFEGNTPFMFACSNGHFTLAKILLKHDVDIKARNNQGSTAFLSACTMGREKVVNLLLDHDADFRLQNFKGQTPLMLASFYGHKQVVEILLAIKDFGSDDVNAKDDNQDTALIFAAQRGQQDYGIYKLLVKSGARENDMNKYNYSASSYYASAKMEFPFKTGVATLFRTITH